MKGINLFEEVAQSLLQIASRFLGSTLKLNGTLKKFSDIEEMLKQERSQFEVKSGHSLDTCFLASCLEE